jgi:hypothetical protein
VVPRVADEPEHHLPVLLTTNIDTNDDGKADVFVGTATRTAVIDHFASDTDCDVIVQN